MIEKLIMTLTEASNKKNSNYIDLKIGQRLRVRRTSLGMTQEELGNTLNVTFQQIQKYERGINRISSAALYEISKALKTDINYFFDSDNNQLSQYNYSSNVSDNIKSAIHESQEVYETSNSANDIETLVQSYLNIKDAKVRESLLKLVKSLSSE